MTNDEILAKIGGVMFQVPEEDQAAMRRFIAMGQSFLVTTTIDENGEIKRSFEDLSVIYNQE